MSEEKEVKVNVRFTIVKALNYGAIAAVIIGLLYGILAAVGAGDYASGTYKFAQFLWGLLWAVTSGGVLAGLGELLSRKQD